MELRAWRSRVDSGVWNVGRWSADRNPHLEQIQVFPTRLGKSLLDEYILVEGLFPVIVAPLGPAEREISKDQERPMRRLVLSMILALGPALIMAGVFVWPDFRMWHAGVPVNGEITRLDPAQHRSVYYRYEYAGSVFEYG